MQPFSFYPLPSWERARVRGNKKSCSIWIYFEFLQESVEKTTITLYSKCLSLGLDMQLLRNEIFVRFPVVSNYFAILDIFDGIPQLLASGCATIAQYAVEEPLSISINSNPDPTIFFFKEI